MYTIKTLINVLFTAFLSFAAIAQNEYTASSTSNNQSPAQNIVLEVQGGALTVFSTLGDFQTAAPFAIISEDFETNAAGGAFQACAPGPANNATNNNCFTPGQIVAGIEFNGNPGDLVLLPPGFNGITSSILGAITFTDTTDVSFSATNIQAVAFDSYAGLAAADVVYSVFDTADVLVGTATILGIGALPSNQFIGIVSPVPIGRINVESLGGNGELLDNVLFGPIGPPPMIPSMGLFGIISLILLLVVFGMTMLRKRNLNI